jgi:hypothetical protein
VYFCPSTGLIELARRGKGFGCCGCVLGESETSEGWLGCMAILRLRTPIEPSMMPRYLTE